MPLRLLEQSLGRANIVLHELVGHETVDLRMPDDERRAVLETRFPVAVASEIRFDDANARLILGEYGDVLRMLVDSDDRAKTASQKARYEVLADQTGGAGHDDAGIQ